MVIPEVTWLTAIVLFILGFAFGALVLSAAFVALIHKAERDAADQ